MNEDVIHVVDYGLGNLGSIMNMFRRLGIKAVLTSSVDEIETAKKLLLPGVGAFDSGMQLLKSRNLFDVLNRKAMTEKIPVLGICLGMQLLTEGSEEGKESGFGWIEGRTVNMKERASPNDNLKFPHIGWNYIDIEHPHYICRDLPEDPRFYFVHSYMVQCDNTDNIVATTDYGSLSFVSICQKDNIVGAQFHPEKSHKFGMQLLRNFAAWSV